MRTAVQLGTPLGNLSQSQAMASVPLPLQFQSQRTALQEERLKSASSLAESVKAATSITQSAPSPQQSLAAGSQTFDLGSAQKVGLDHQENVVSHLPFLQFPYGGSLCWIELADLCRFECLHASLEVFGSGEGMVSFFKILECYTHQMRLWSMWAGFTVGSRDSLFILSKWPVCHSKSRVSSLSSGRNCRYY